MSEVGETGKKNKHREPVFQSLLHAGKCVLHPGIFFKARGWGKGGESLRPLAVSAVPSGSEAWSASAPPPTPMQGRKQGARLG